MNFEDLVKRITPKLRAISIKLDGKYTSFDDEDLYQEALFNIWEKYKRKELCDKTDSYILQGCFFFLKNYIRKSHTRIDGTCVSLNKVISDGGNTLEDMLSVDSMGEEKNTKEVGLLIENIGHFLTEREKGTFILSLEEFTTREIGHKLRISHVMVVKILKKVRDKCKILRGEII